MKIYTIQLAKRKRAEERGIPLLDITVKTGLSSGFAPTWEMVWGSKGGTLSNGEYTKQYYALMRLSYLHHREKWLSILHQDNVAIACYCRTGVFCHRHVLKEILEKVAKIHQIEFIDGGEIE